MSEHDPETSPEPADIPEAPDDLDLSALADLAFGPLSDVPADAPADEHEPGYVETDDHVEDDLVYLDDDGEEVARP